MTLLLFLGMPLLATAAIAVVAPPLVVGATLLALAWGALGVTIERRASAARERTR